MSTINITRLKVLDTINAVLEPVDPENRVSIYNEGLATFVSRYRERDPWLLTREAYLFLRKYHLQEKTVSFAMFLLNGNQNDEDVVLLAKKHFEKRFPPLEEQRKEIT